MNNMKKWDMKKKNDLKMLLMLILLFVMAGCGNDKGESDKAGNVGIDSEVIVDFDVKEILSNYSVTPEQESAIVKIMNNLHDYLEVNIDEILKESLRKKKRAKKINKEFIHGKISVNSLEYYINDQIEEYNDEHSVNDRLHNVTLEIVMDTMSVSPIYNNMLVKDWIVEGTKFFFLKQGYIYEQWIENKMRIDKDSERRTLVKNDMMNAYYAIFKAENLIEQMIGVEKNK